MQIRSDILERELCRAMLPEAAGGAAILAAAAMTGEPLATRAAAMVKMGTEVSPRRTNATRYREIYQRFVQALGTRGYRNEEI